MTKSCTTLEPEEFESTLSAVEADASAGRGTFHSTTGWFDDARARTVPRSFRLTVTTTSGATSASTGAVTRITDDAGAFAATDRGEMT